MFLRTFARFASEPFWTRRTACLDRVNFYSFLFMCSAHGSAGRRWYNFAQNVSICSIGTLLYWRTTTVCCLLFCSFIQRSLNLVLFLLLRSVLMLFHNETENCCFGRYQPNNYAAAFFQRYECLDRSFLCFCYIHTTSHKQQAMFFYCSFVRFLTRFGRWIGVAGAPEVTSPFMCIPSSIWLVCWGFPKFFLRPFVIRTSITCRLYHRTEITQQKFVVLRTFYKS